MSPHDRFGSMNVAPGATLCPILKFGPARWRIPEFRRLAFRPVPPRSGAPASGERAVPDRLPLARIRGRFLSVARASEAGAGNFHELQAGAPQKRGEVGRLSPQFENLGMQGRQEIRGRYPLPRGNFVENRPERSFEANAGALTVEPQPSCLARVSFRILAREYPAHDASSPAADARFSCRAPIANNIRKIVNGEPIADALPMIRCPYIRNGVTR